MHADQNHDEAELSYPDRGAHRLIVRRRCWPLPLAPVDDLAAVPMTAFDERRAASLACAEPGGSGYRKTHQRIAAIVAAERAAA